MAHPIRKPLVIPDAESHKGGPPPNIPRDTLSGRKTLIKAMTAEWVIKNSPPGIKTRSEDTLGKRISRLLKTINIVARRSQIKP
jgi:hypothetical protein